MSSSVYLPGGQSTRSDVTEDLNLLQTCTLEHLNKELYEVKVKVEQSRYRSGVAQRAPGS
jgi:hypothetical protein